MFKFFTQTGDASFLQMRQDAKIEDFLESSIYWQNINLRARLLLAKNLGMDFEKSKRLAIQQWSDPKKLKYDLAEALNSPK